MKQFLLQPDAPKAQAGYRSGFVALVGPPNAGKSTLLNRLLGQKISIVSQKPQTTRQKVLGVFHLSDLPRLEKQSRRRLAVSGQIVFLDTPGLIEASPSGEAPINTLNRSLGVQARAGIQDSDRVVWVFDGCSAKRDDHFWQDVRGLIDSYGASKPATIVLNKGDLLKKRDKLDLLVQAEAAGCERPFLVSAKSGEGLVEFLLSVAQSLPEGPPYYPEEMITDRPASFFLSELIREKIYRVTHREIPYDVHVEVEAVEEDPALYRAACAVIVARQSQKAILVGAGGDMIKRIGSLAREELERQMKKKVYLDLRVRVQQNWSRQPERLREYGYR